MRERVSDTSRLRLPAPREPGFRGRFCESSPTDHWPPERPGENRHSVLETALPAVIHNPADRKPGVTSLPSVAQPKSSPPRTGAGTFVSLFSEPASSGTGSEGASGNGPSSGAER